MTLPDRRPSTTGSTSPVARVFGRLSGRATMTMPGIGRRSPVVVGVTGETTNPARPIHSETLAHRDGRPRHGPESHRKTSEQRRSRPVFWVGQTSTMMLVGGSEEPARPTHNGAKPRPAERSGRRGPRRTESAANKSDRISTRGKALRGRREARKSTAGETVIPHENNDRARGAHQIWPTSAPAVRRGEIRRSAEGQVKLEAARPTAERDEASRAARRLAGRGRDGARCALSGSPHNTRGRRRAGRRCRPRCLRCSDG